MKLKTEDDDLPPLDQYTQLLMKLWLGGYSINKNTAGRSLTVYPSVMTEELNAQITENYDLLSHYLPGNCDACKSWVLVRTESYWGAHPHLCPMCLSKAIIWFNKNNTWPEANWFEGEFGE